MRRTLALPLAVLSAAAALTATAAPAVAAPRATVVKPKVVRVTPMRVDIGEVLTIRGRGFLAKARRNTVIFKGVDGRTAFAKPRRATRRKLVVKVPGSVARLLVLRDGKHRPTRLQLRVLARKFSAFTPRRLSPVVVGFADAGVDKDGDGVPDQPIDICKSGGDYDGDLLPNALEASLGTNPCLRDTDGDGVEDGYEVQAAIDFNHYPATPPLQYPGKRPYPNALDPGDAEEDYDGDGLRLREEYLLWRDYAADSVHRAGRPTTLFPLIYSDGLQKSLDPPPAVPDDPLYAWVLDQPLGGALGEAGDGVLSDGERDADADGLGNWDEIRGRFTEAWWVAALEDPKESKYPPGHGNFLDNDDLPRGDAHVNPDIDGDGVLDGADDQDHDGVPNQFEIRRPLDWVAEAIVGYPDAAANPWAYVNPFNPCKPFNSERCHEHPPFGYYDSDDMPFMGPNPPPGFPGGGPATPAGP